MKRMKKLVSLLLTVVMLLGMTSVFAQAATQYYDENYFQASLDLLQDYIEKNGYINGYGDPTISFSDETNDAIITSESDGLHFFNFDDFDSAETYVEMVYDKSDVRYVHVNIEFYMDRANDAVNPNFNAYAKIDTLNYDKTQNINFSIDGDYRLRENHAKLANTSFSIAFSCWKILLLQNGFYISELGFANYCPGHSKTLTYNEEATCTTPGTKLTVCYYCGLIMKEETIPAGNHRWNSGKVTKEATCSDAGEKLFTCKDCGATKTEAIPATGKHNYSKTVTPATTTSNGSVAQVCADCGAAGTTKTIHRIDTVTLDANSFTYDGTAKTPAVTVKDIKGKVVNPKYYTVKYADDCTEIGAYKVKVVFKGLYSGTASCTFKIVPGKVTDLRAASKKTGVAKVAWSPVDGAQKYVIYCSATKKGGYQKVAVTAKTAYNVKDLASGKTYYFTVKALTQTGGKNYFSTVSNIAKARVK